jgi:hypothetical protein
VAADSVESSVAGSAALSGQELRHVVAEADELGAHDLGAASDGNKTVNGSSSFKVMDEVGLLPSPDGNAAPTRRVNDGVAERRDRLLAKEPVLICVGLEMAA